MTQTSDAALIRRQQEEIEELKERVRQLTPADPGPLFPLEWALQPAHCRALHALYSAPGGFLSHARVYEALRKWSNGDMSPTVRKQIHEMRQRLSPYGIIINSRFGMGYELTPKSRTIIKAAIEQKVAA